MSRASIAVVAVALFAALGGGGSAAEAKRAHAGKSRAPATGSADCKADSDCVAVLDDCCPCSEGGRQRAVPKKERAAYEKDRKRRCEGTMCTEVVSQDATCAQRVSCDAGICELIDAPADAPP